MSYQSFIQQYQPRKVVVSGANGRNGFTTLEMLTHLPLDSLIGLVRKEEQIQQLYDRLRQHQEMFERHSEIVPIITCDPEQASYAHIWINWKGMNLATLQKINPNFEQEAQEKGIHSRDMLLEGNAKIAIEDSDMAKTYAPNCVYMQQGNPCDVLAHAVNQNGFERGKVISTGTLMEYYRFTKLFALAFPDFTLERATGIYIGEHGELAVAVPESISMGGVNVHKLVESRYGSDGLAKLEDVFSRVANEAYWLRERTGETPSYGPASVSVDLVKAMIHPTKSTVFGISTSLDGEYGLDDLHISVPATVDRSGARVLEIRFRDEVMGKFYDAARHIQEMNHMLGTINQ
jgi:malate/lactate dehydrogenase